MSELRQDPTTRNWVIIAPERSRRPSTFRERRERQLAEADGCPFCPGREAETPGALWQLSDSAGAWRVRVIPNKFPALVEGGQRRRRITPQGFVGVDGVGRHEVVIESRDHDADLATADPALVRDVLAAYRDRYRALRADRAALIVVFRNHGPGAGTSLAHPHSQIVAAPIVPYHIRHRLAVAEQHYDDLGTCLYLDIIEREVGDGRRIVLANDRFVAFQPYASTSPFETWILPRAHQASFGDATDEALDALAPLLRAVLAGLRRELDDPDYNYVINSAPPGEEAHEYFIWHLRIVPRLASPAGFELGSGIRINPSSPEAAAAALRRAIEYAAIG